MNFDLLLKVGGPMLISMLQSAITSFHAPTQPAAPVPVNEAPAGTVASPDEFIRHLQAFLNLVVKPSPPLDEDGWLGNLTRAAGEKAIVMFKAAAGIG